MPTTTLTSEPRSRWKYFKETVKDAPLIFWPIMVIIPVAFSRFFVEDLLIGSIINMASIAAFGVQWIGLIRGHKKRQLDMITFDKKQLRDLVKYNTGDQVKFMTPCKASVFRTAWNRFQKTRLVYLYQFSSGLSSNTKIHMTNKEWFYLQLCHHLNTSDGEQALKGMKYLSRDDHVMQVTT